MRQAHVSHQLPGRLRIKVPAAKGDREVLEEIKVSLLPEDGITDVDINTTTGSVVIHYEPEFYEGFTARVAEHFRTEQLGTLVLERQSGRSEGIHTIKDVFRSLEDKVKRETHDSVDLKELFPLAIAAYDYFFVKRSRSTPMWLTLILFAFSSYMDLHKADPNRQVIVAVDALRAEVAALRTEIHTHAQLQH
jgi:Heavy metal associated domain 2